MEAIKMYLEKHTVARQAGQACLDLVLKDAPLLSKRVGKAWSCEL